MIPSWVLPGELKNNEAVPAVSIDIDRCSMKKDYSDGYKNKGNIYWAIL